MEQGNDFASLKISFRLCGSKD